MNIEAALRRGRAAGIASLDAQLLLGEATGLSRTALIVHGHRNLTRAEEDRWSAWLERRRAGEPLAYLLGRKEFCGLMLEVTPDVLIPRPETELLVEWAASLVAGMPAPASVLDLGTGSGAVALALKQRNPESAVTASDVSGGALSVARRNARRLGLDIEFAAGSWWQPLAGRRFDVVVSNPPYIAAGDDHLPALQHEPRLALTPGGNGTGAITAIVKGAAAHLSADGWLLLEHGFDQAEAVRALLRAAGLEHVETRPDLGGHARASGGRAPGAAP